MPLFCRCNSDHADNARRVEDLSRTVDGLKRERASLNTAFEELQDKVFRWMQRTNKRERDEAKALAGDTDVAGEEPRAYANHPVVRRIMERRGLIRNGG